jgi:hypothetical protein
MTHAGHLKIAFFIWFVVGAGLLIAGGRFTWGADVSQTGKIVAVVVGAAIGFGKGSFVLPKVAKKNVDRIRQLPTESPIYGTFSLKSWGLVLMMILLGRGLRAAGLPPVFVGAIYMAVGFALILGSRGYLTISGRNT